MTINEFIQNKLEEKGLDRELALIINQWTHEAGVLNDDRNRPGRPLRQKCRDNEIHGAVKEDGRWFIYRVGDTVDIDNADNSEVTTLADISIDYIEGLVEYECFFEGIYTRSLLYHLLSNDPFSLIVKTRIAGEHISRLIAKQRFDNYEDVMTLFDVVNLLSEEGVISDFAKNIMHSLRIYGNIALHKPNDLLEHEKSLARIACSTLHLYLNILKDKGLLQGLGELPGS